MIELDEQEARKRIQELLIIRGYPKVGSDYMLVVLEAIGLIKFKKDEEWNHD